VGAVDLHRMDGDAAGGIVRSRGGTEFWSMTVGQDGDGDYTIRFETGWHEYYTRSGLLCEPILVNGVRQWTRDLVAPNSDGDIVSFDRCEREVAMARGIPVNWRGR